MSEPSLIEREAKVLEDLAQGATERAAGEAKLTGELATRGVTIESEYRSARRALEQKIAQAERDAVAEVRASAVDIAIEAARKVLADKVDARTGAELFASSLQELKAKLN